MRIVGYILKGHEPVPVYNMTEWATWFEHSYKTGERQVAKDELPDGTVISTVFLGLDHSFRQSGPPILFETMIFDEKRKGIGQWRYCTWDEAKRGHMKAIVLCLGEKAKEYVDKYDTEY